MKSRTDFWRSTHGVRINQSLKGAPRRWEVNQGSGRQQSAKRLLLIPELKHRLLDRVDLTVPGTILTDGGSQLDGTMKGLLQGFVADEYGNSHLVRIDILIMCGIGSNLYPVNTAGSKGTASIFYIENPRLEGHGIIIPLHVGENNPYSFVLDFSADGYGVAELAINAATNANNGG